MGRHHSSEPKKKGLRQKIRRFFERIDSEDQKKGFHQKFRRFFQRIDGEDQNKKNGRIDGEDQKLRRKSFRRYIAAYVPLKRKGCAPDDNKQSQAG